MRNRYIIAMTGASGVDYALRFLWRLSTLPGESDLIFSENFFKVLQHEGLFSGLHSVSGLFELLEKQYGIFERKHVFQIADFHDVSARAASGSAQYRSMLILPCSMKTLAAIAHGLSQNLIERAADVSLKERRPLIVCPRETPLSSIQLRNMLMLSEAGATVMPLMPGYYHRPQSLSDLADFMIDRVLSHLGFAERVITPWRA